MTLCLCHASEKHLEPKRLHLRYNMTLAEVTLFVLASIGMTDLIVESKIFSPIRWVFKKILPTPLYEVFECHQCMGTWCGLVCAAMLWGWGWTLLLGACAGSFVGSLYFLISEVLESKIVYTFGDDNEHKEV